MKNKNNNFNQQSCQLCAVKFFEQRKPFWKRERLIIGISCLIILATGLFLEFLTSYKLPAQILFMVVVVISGKDIIKSAFKSLIKKKHLDMNFLMTIAAVGAFLIGHGEEGAAIIFLFFIAESLEDYAADRAKRSIGKLLELAPETARVKKDSKEIEVHVHDIEKKDIVIVKPGEKVPLDGKIIKGSSSVNQASITGESLPVNRKKGDEVYGGTINQEGYLEIEVTKRTEEGILSKIAKLVEEAEKKKSNTEAFVEKFASIYTPAVIGLAMAVAIVPALFFNLPLSVWLYRALVLLVVSCPCALAISTPVSMVSAITSSSHKGVLIKGSTYIESLNGVKAFAFDKTGTVTEGRLEVSDVLSLSSFSKENILSLASSIEIHSEHPIAKAIVKKAKQEKVNFYEVEHFKAMAGKGAKAQIDNKTYYIGAKNLFKDLKIRLDDHKIKDFEQEGKTAVFLSDKQKFIGIIAVRDKIREDSFRIIKELKERGIKTVMITGDNERTAKAIAQQIGVDEYHAQLLPQEKVNIIDKLNSKFGCIAMVGDGINDAPSLATSSVGIAMGAIGSDVALDTADVALMHDDLSKISYLINLAKKTLNIVKQNVTTSIIIKSSFAILALLGMISLWLAVAIGDMGLSLAVILNAMRLGGEK